jgi:tetratricopeptide (TPR) repeat protein
VISSNGRIPSDQKNNYLLMKKMLTTLLPFLSAMAFVCVTSAQTRKADSLKQLLANEKDGTRQFDLNKQVCFELVQYGKLDQALHYINQLFTIAAHAKSDSLLMASYFVMAGYCDHKTDSKEEIEYALKALAIAENKFPASIFRAYYWLGAAYIDLRNYGTALTYLRKGLFLFKPSELNLTPRGLYLQFALAFDYLGQPDSVLHYAQLYNEYLIKHRDRQNEKDLLRLEGNAYSRLGNFKLAESLYQNSIDEDTASKTAADAFAAEAYARFLLRRGELNKAKLYGLKGLNAAISTRSKVMLLENVATLREIFETNHQMDSAYYFSKLELAYRDSLFNQDKLYAVQEIAFKERLRQQEEAMKESEKALQLKHNLQYAAIALGMISFCILFLLISHSIIANPRLIRFLGVVALLIVFEFINLYIHPYLSRATNDSPLLMLLVLVCIAALLVPIHNKMEHWVTHKMVEKNNRIRLAAAKRTIAMLEEKN